MVILAAGEDVRRGESLSVRRDPSVPPRIGTHLARARPAWWLPRGIQPSRVLLDAVPHVPIRFADLEFDPRFGVQRLDFGDDLAQEFVLLLQPCGLEIAEQHLQRATSPLLLR